MSRLHPLSLSEKLFFFSSGIIVSVPLTLFAGSLTDLLCIPLPLFYAQVCSTALFTPSIEEFAKAYPLFYRHGETQRSLLLLGLLVGLGFGLSEFIVFVTLLQVPFYIRLPGIFFHVASTSITTYGIIRGKPIPYYLLAVFLHFLNNISALLNLYLIGGGLALMITYFLAWHFYQKTDEVWVDNK